MSFWSLLIILTYVFVELFSFAGLLLINRVRNTDYMPVDVMPNRHAAIISDFIEEKTNYLVFSPTLGWSIKKNGSSTLFQANSSGIRSDREYTFTPREGHRRVSTFGDSFTHCDEVKNNETWQSIMESYDSKIEVPNFGVCGFGLDQAYLRYLEEAGQYKSQIVLIGFMSENIYRSVNTYRPFYSSRTGIPLTKPRFVVNDDKLSLISNPIKRVHDYKALLMDPKGTLAELGTNDYYYQKLYKSGMLDWSPTHRLFKILTQKISNRLSQKNIIAEGMYNEKSEAFLVTKKLLDEFYNKVISDTSVPVILIFPSQDDIIRYRAEKTKKYTPLLQHLSEKGFRYMDLMDALEGFDVEGIFAGNHYSPHGNKLVAKYVFEYLTNMNQP